MRRRLCKVKHLGCTGGALLTAWVTNPSESTPWQRGWKRHHSVATKSCVPRRCALCRDPAALWGSARKGWFEKPGTHHTGIVPWISQRLWPYPLQPGALLRSAFALLRNKILMLCFPTSRNQRELGREIQELQRFPDLLTERKMHSEQETREKLGMDVTYPGINLSIWWF